MNISKTTVGIVVALIGAIATVSSAFVTAHYTNLSNQDKISVLENQRTQVASPQGTYLWQVAIAGDGQRWKGYIEADEHGAAQIQMWRWNYCPPNNELRQLRLLEQQPGNALVTIPQQGRLHISIPVRMIRYDSSCEMLGGDARLEPQVILEAELAQTLGYEGRVAYKGINGEAPLGGMILVKEVPGSEVNTN